MEHYRNGILNEFRRLKSVFNGVNEYEYARKHNELPDFYFGRNKYYQLDFESSEHYALNTYEEIKKYTDQIGKENFIPLFLQDIEFLTTSELTVKELFYVFYFLYMMSKFVYDNELLARINLSREVVDLLKAKLEEFDHLYGDHIKEGESYNEIEDSRAWPPELVKTCKKTMVWMHERFGYSQFAAS